jgi:Tol biopolymer transport system component
MQSVRLTVCSWAAVLVVVVAVSVAACGGPTENTMVMPTPTATGTIAFTDGEGQISVVAADGTGLRRLTSYPGGVERPAWSPDGSRIAYFVYPEGNGNPTSDGLWVMNADGSGQRQIAADTVHGFWPAWSPDGAKIAFIGAYPMDVWNLSAVNADGSGFKRLSEEGGAEFAPAWTPDGRILFVRGGHLMAVNPDGSGRTELKAVGDAADGIFALSPDGATLAVQRPGSSSRVDVVPFPGGGTSVSLLDPLSDYLMKNRLATLSWSSDGKSLVVAANDWKGVKGSRLFIVGADGSGLAAIPGVKDAYDPAWRPQ